MPTVPIEAKVKASTVTTFAVGVGIAVLNDVAADSSLLGPLPSWLQAAVLALAPGAAAFLAGYQARHTPRQDPAARAAADAKGL